METQATYRCERSVPALATLAPLERVACATCGGTGALGRTERMESHGGALLVLTTTNWCPTCKGAGQVFSQ